MAENDATAPSPTEQGEEEDLATTLLSGLSHEEILLVLKGTPGLDEAGFLETLTSAGALNDFLESLTMAASANDDEDGQIIPKDEPLSPPAPVTEPPSVPKPMECAQIEVVTKTPILVESKTETIVPAVTKEAPVLPVVPENPPASNEPKPSTSAAASLPVTVASIKTETHSSEPPSPNDDLPKSKHRDRDHHEKKKKKKKDKVTRKLSSDSSESIHKHKSKKKQKEREKPDVKPKNKDLHKEAEVNAAKAKMQKTIEKYRNKFKLKLPAVIAVDVKEIVLLKRHMKFRSEKLSKIEEVDKDLRLQFQKKEGYTTAKFASTKSKYNKFYGRESSSSRPEKSSSKRKEEDRSHKKNRKRVYCASDDSDSDNDKKHKKPNVKPEKDKDKKHKEKDKESYTASGARIMPYEKRHSKEQAAIRRPKMSEPDATIKKEEKNKRIGMHDPESSKRLNSLLQEAGKTVERKKLSLIANQFKIPKARKAEELLPPSHDVSKGQPPPVHNPPDVLRAKLEAIRNDSNTKFRMPTPGGFANANPQFGNPQFGNPPFGGGRGRGGPGPRQHCPRFKKITTGFDYEEEMRYNSKSTIPPIKPEDKPPGRATRLDTYDDDNVEMIDLPSDEEEDNDNVPPPIAEVRFSDAARTAFKLIYRGSVPLPELKDHSRMSTNDAIAHKCAWWFQTMDKDKVPYTSPCVPELDDNGISSDYGDGSQSSFGNVSNPDNADECQSNEVSSSDQRANEMRLKDPDLRDEYCGATLLSAKFRTSADDTFQNIFELRPGTNYERENLQAKCSICDELIIGKRHLGSHLRSEDHRENFKNISLSVMTRPGKDKPNVPGADLSSTKRDSNNRAEREKPSKEKEGRDKEVGNSSKSKREGRMNGNGSSSGGGGVIGNMSVTSSRSRVNVMDEIVERVSRTGSEPTHLALHIAGPLRSGQGFEEPVDRVSRAGGSGISMASPISAASIPIPIPAPVPAPSQRDKRKSRSKSPAGRHRGSDRRRRSKSRSPRRRHTRSRSPANRRRQGRGRSRSRSRSPRRTSNRSPPARRAPQLDAVDAFLAKCANRDRSRSPRYRNTSHRSRSRSPAIAVNANPGRGKNNLFPEKLKLTAFGLWTPALEAKWMLMEAEEAALNQNYQERLKNLATSAETFPNYKEEWDAWWGQKYQEVDKRHLNPDTYDYIPEWKEFWTKRAEVILTVELESQIEAVRSKYGMTMDSLQRLLLGIPAPVAAPIPEIEVPLPAEIQASIANVPVAPVPGPSSAGLTRPGPSFAGLNRPGPSSAGLTPVSGAGSSGTPAVANLNNADIYSPFEEDFTARSMSVSSGGSTRIGERPKVTKAQPVAGPSRPITAETVMGTWEQMTGQKISGSASDVGSARSAMSIDMEKDFDGNDIVQVLQLMTKSEDQLGILSQQVHIFTKKAEELEAAKAKASFTLLENKEFVVLLFQCRDKFNKLMSANFLPRDVMKRLNFTVYKLNLILELDACQNLRSLVPPAPDTLEVPAPAPPAPPIMEALTEMVRRNANGMGLGPSTSVGPSSMLKQKDYGKIIREGVKNISDKDKIAMSSIITPSLLSQRRDSISDPALVRYVYEILEPILTINIQNNLSSALSGISSRSNHSRTSQGSANGGSRQLLANPLFRPTIFPGQALPELIPPTEQGVEGTALPRLPVLECRAVSPPLGASRYVGRHYQSVPQMSRNDGPGGPGPSSSSAYRQSPARRGPPPAVGNPSTREPYNSNSRKRSRTRRKGRRKDNRKPVEKPVQNNSNNSKSRTSSSSNSRKEVGVAQEFWNSDVSSISSKSGFGIDDSESHPKHEGNNTKENQPEINEGHPVPVSIPNRSNLRKQPKARPTPNTNPEISDPESGEILSDDTLSSISVTKSSSEEDDQGANLMQLGEIRQKISRRLSKNQSSETSAVIGEAPTSAASASESSNSFKNAKRRSHSRSKEKKRPSRKKRSRSPRRIRSASLSPERIRLSLHQSSKSKRKHQSRDRERKRSSKRKSTKRHSSRNRSRDRGRSRDKPRHIRSAERMQKCNAEVDDLIDKYRKQQVKAVRRVQKPKKLPKSNPINNDLRLNRAERSEIFAEAGNLEVVSSASASSVGSMSPEPCTDGIKPFPFTGSSALSNSGLEAEDEMVVPVQELCPDDSTPCQDEVESDVEIIHDSLQAKAEQP